METRESTDRVIDRTMELLEAYECDFGMGGAKPSPAVFREKLTRILCEELKDRRIVSIPDLKDKLKVEKAMNQYAGSYEFRVRLTTKAAVPFDVYDLCAATPEEEAEFMKAMEDSLKESFVYSLDKKDD